MSRHPGQGRRERRLRKFVGDMAKPRSARHHYTALSRSPLTLFQDGPVRYEVSLFRYDRKRDGWELSFTAATKNKEYGFQASGTGNAWTVFGTVIDIARQFIALRQPQTMKIESDITERSRVAVNRRLAFAIIQNLPYEIEDEGYAVFLHRVAVAKK